MPATLTPALLILLALDAPPALSSACLNADEELLLWAWIHRNPDIAELVRRAEVLADSEDQDGGTTA